MKINSIPSKTLYAQYVHSKERSAETSRPSMGTDKVELTNGAQSFSAVLKAARETFNAAPDHGERVEEVKRQVQNHTYSVPGYAVAARIMGDVQE